MKLHRLPVTAFRPGDESAMAVLTPRTTRRSTRVRVQIPVSVISLDRSRPFGDRCTVLVVSAHGCGFQCSEALQIETPIMLSDLPGGGSVTARVATCVPLGNDGEHFLIGAALYTHGNVWGIADPPEDWKFAPQNTPLRSPSDGASASASRLKANQKAWPYNLVPESGNPHPERK
jgi:hypothetical protein